MRPRIKRFMKKFHSPDECDYEILLFRRRVNMGTESDVSLVVSLEAIAVGIQNCILGR